MEARGLGIPAPVPATASAEQEATGAGGRVKETRVLVCEGAQGAGAPVDTTAVGWVASQLTRVATVTRGTGLSAAVIRRNSTLASTELTASDARTPQDQGREPIVQVKKL